MIFSYSSWRTYQKCQRMWLYASEVKSSRAKNDRRRKIAILSNLQSIDAWRGEIVDFTISNFIIRELNKGFIPTLDQAIQYARKISRKRYDFAKGKRYWEANMVKSRHQEEYAALFGFEFNTGLTNEDFKKAWQEIESSLVNFFNFETLIETLENEDNRLLAQRPLHLEINGFKIKGIPDLIILNENAPPHIIDWKVHISSSKTYNEQLLIYALALSRSKHKDFPEYFYEFPITDYRLSEFQLLSNEHREYPITEDYLDEIEFFLADSTYQLHLASGGANYIDIQLEDFEVASNPETCATCPFHKICTYENQ
jgi:hypothetical protein